jgi:hypothetical protein
MYETFEEVVKAVREKYANAEKLSKTEFDMCIYSHKENGIGCAIGCLFAAEVAESFDQADPHTTLTVSALLENKQIHEAVRQVISPIIRVDRLTDLQLWHDTSDSVAEFLQNLDAYLESCHA